MFSVVCWKWKPHTGAAPHQHFNGQHVNVLRSMVKRHYQKPHRFICVTDDPTAIDANEVEIVPLWRDHASLPSPMGARGPSCYRRLKMFSSEASQWFGERFVSLDLDCVILGDLSPLWDRPDDFMMWGDTAKGTPYNGSMILLNAGARTKVWETFDPVKSPAIGRRLGYIGSDQAWIGACLGPNEKKWSAADGVLSFRNEIKRGKPVNGARIVFFHGYAKPWDSTVHRQYPWIKQNWR